MFTDRECPKWDLLLKLGSPLQVLYPNKPIDVQGYDTENAPIWSWSSCAYVCVSIIFFLPHHSKPCRSQHLWNFIIDICPHTLIFTGIHILKVKICVWDRTRHFVLWPGLPLFVLNFLFIAGFSFLLSWGQFYCVSMSQFCSPFFCWWPFRLVLFPCYSEECNSEYSG